MRAASRRPTRLVECVVKSLVYAESMSEELAASPPPLATEACRAIVAAEGKGGSWAQAEGPERQAPAGALESTSACGTWRKS